MNVICFGDSNTYGYDPRSYLGGRYDPDSRWVDGSVKDFSQIGLQALE